MANGEKFCLRWNEFENNISSSFRELRDDKDFFDVTLACDGNQLQAHKVILSACSPFFRSVLKKNPHQHPLLYLKGVKYEDIISVLNFMYHGEVNVAQEELNSFLAVAEDLQVKGLTQKGDKQSQPLKPPPVATNKRPQEHYQTPPPVRIPKPPKQPTIDKSSYDHPMPRTDSYQPRREVQEFTPQIKTETPVILDCEEATENIHEMVEADDYQGDYGYEEETYQEEHNMMYQGGDVNMGQSANNDQNWGQEKLQFPCEYCEKSFINKRSYYNHLGIHKGRTTCTVCQKMFSTTSNLGLHMRNVHSSM